MAGVPSLYERLGGEAAVEAVVVPFYRKVMADPELEPFFHGFDVQAQMEKHIVFLMKVFGGPVQQPPPDLKRAHAALVRRGLSDKHVDGFIRILREILSDLEVPAADIDEALAALDRSRRTVLGSDDEPKPGGGRGGGAGGGGGAGAGAAGGGRGLLFDQVIVNEGGQARIFSPKEFLALPLGVRVTFVVKNLAEFYLGDQRINAELALADARKRRAAGAV